jgi:hypothetical protein
MDDPAPKLATVNMIQFDVLNHLVEHRFGAGRSLSGEARATVSIRPKGFLLLSEVSG